MLLLQKLLPVRPTGQYRPRCSSRVPSIMAPAATEIAGDYDQRAGTF